MESLNPLRRRRRRPLYQTKRADPSTYLTTARIHLLRTLPQSHRLHDRTLRNGSLKSSGHPPVVPRVPFTETELVQIRLRRKYTPDPDNVRYQLQDSKLVQMWNADYEHEEQWRDYDVARPVMESKRSEAGLPEEMFHTDEIVDEKRRRILSDMYPNRVAVDGDIVESTELEDGEIEEAGYFGDSDEIEEDEDEDEDQETALRNLREENKTLQTANDAMRMLAKALEKGKREAGMTLSSPSTEISEDSDSSGDGSGESDMAICEFDLKDLDDDVDDIEDVEDYSDDGDKQSGTETSTLINSRVGKVDSDPQVSRKLLAMQDESEGTQSGHELG